MIKVIEGTLNLPDGERFGQITVDFGKISAIENEKSQFVEPDLIVPNGQFVSPGFIDIQINGAFGKEFKSDIDSVDVITKGLPRFGTTAICPTVTTKNLSSYSSHIASLKEHYIVGTGSKVLGFHLEGPFLNPKKTGAQNADLLKTPLDCDLATYATPDVAIVTLAPELEGAPSLIELLISNGIKVGVGHSLATFDELVGVFDPDNMMIVHIFNAMDALQSRSPGVVGAALVNNDYFVSLIADGVHVDPAVVKIIWKCKEDKHKLFCITDGSAVTGLSPGTHTVGDRRIEKHSDRAVLEGTSTLVGSILTQNVAAKNLRTFTGCTISEAVNAVSLNPAMFLGVSGSLGQIQIGNIADLVIHDENFNIRQTYIDGQLVWSSDSQ